MLGVSPRSLSDFFFTVIGPSEADLYNDGEVEGALQDQGVGDKCHGHQNKAWAVDWVEMPVRANTKAFAHWLGHRKAGK